MFLWMCNSIVMFKNEHTGALLWITASVLALLLVLAWIFVREQNTTNDQTSASILTAEINGEPVELEIEDIQEGSGRMAQPGHTLSMHYVGTLDDGTVFDSSRERGEPFVFILGSGQVIQGWELGVVGIKEGGIRKLTIPPELGYGSQGVGPIPPNATLNFEIELVSIVE